MTRMLHVEFSTELLLFAYSGYHMNKKTKLDEVIRGDALDLKELKVAAKRVDQVFRAVEMILPGLRSTRFRRRADFYSLVTLLLQFKSDGRIINAHESNRNELARALLSEFAYAVDEVSERSSKA